MKSLKKLGTGVMILSALCCSSIGLGDFALAKETAPRVQLDKNFNPTVVYSKLKGFMVFLNWYFGEKPPYIVTDGFRRHQFRGVWSQYKGVYGGFHDVTVDTCQDKIVKVEATARPIQGGVKRLVKSWLRPELLPKVRKVGDSASGSTFVLGGLPGICQQMQVSVQMHSKKRSF